MHGELDQKDQAARRKLRLPCRLLVVDDLDDQRGLLEILLQPQSFEVVLAASGDEALALINGYERFAGALIDCAMPGMDGFELAKQIRAREKERGITPPMKLGMITANVELVRLTTLLEEVSASLFLRKPEDMDRFLGLKIAVWLGCRQVKE